VALSVGGDPTIVEARLRAGDPAVIARVADDRVLLDFRTVLPREDDLLAAAIMTAVGAPS
jgi:hypothetical protein